MIIVLCREESKEGRGRGEGAGSASEDRVQELTQAERQHNQRRVSILREWDQSEATSTPKVGQNKP